MVCVVGVDGSGESRAALRWGCDFAAAMADRLWVVRAWEYPSMSILPGGSASLRPPDEVDAVVATEVSEFVREVLGTRGDDVEVLAERGPADFALVQAVRQLRATTLVVGKRGLGAVTGRLLGSVSRRLAEHAPCPVVIVPTELAGMGGPIVVGADGSANAAAAMRWAIAAAKATGATITAVHGLYAPFTELAGTIIEQAQAQAHGQSVADEQCDAASAAGIECGTVVKMRDPRELIGQVAGESNASMIVVGARGTGTLDSLLLGSVASFLVQYGDRPLAVVSHRDAGF